MANVAEQNTESRQGQLAGKYLTFTLGGEDYGIPVLKVREIIQRSDITEVPRMPDYVRGVINLRGKVVPIVDLRLKFELMEFATNERTCIVVVEVVPQSGIQSMLGMVVDVVDEVVQIFAENIEPPPSFGAVLNTDCILGMGKVKGSVKSLLDIDKLMGGDFTDASIS